MCLRYPLSLSLSLSLSHTHIDMYIDIRTHTHRYVYTHTHIHIYIYHHVVPLARISLTLSRHFSLSFFASGSSSGLHPVSSHSCSMYVLAGRPAFAQPYVGAHRSTSLVNIYIYIERERERKKERGGREKT